MFFRGIRYYPGSFNSRPHKEVDGGQNVQGVIGKNFQFTTSQGGRPGGQRHYEGSRRLSIHDLTRRSTVIRPRSSYSLAIFQFTTSQGGRPPNVCSVNVFRTFQFTTSQGGRLNLKCRWHSVKIFQFTTSQGGRPVIYKSFGSNNNLSIHDLTRRSTCTIFANKKRGLSFNSRPHKEVDLYGIPTIIGTLSFNSRPHKEVDNSVS